MSNPDAQPAAATDDRLARLEALLASLGSVVVCLSGGVDSALLLAVAARALGPRALALTAVSPSLADAERSEALAVAQAIGVEHLLVESHEIDRDEYADNSPDRCFHCKSELYRIAHEVRVARGFDAIVNGANADDVGDFRPGSRAAERAGVRSPLLELGLRKQDVRELARGLGLSVWDKPAAACLASRVPYGMRITSELLTRIAEAEASLKALGFGQLRVRAHGEVARIELEPSAIERAASAPVRASIVAAVTGAGFRYVTLDLGGYRQGSHNEVLSDEVRAAT